LWYNHSMGGPLAFRKDEMRAEACRKVVFPVVRTKRDKWKRDTKKLSREVLALLYTERGKSMAEIANIIGCSHHKVIYWMERYKISRRTRSDATYKKRNPQGDPFLFRTPQTQKERELFGLGVGLFWGEGTKAIKTNSVRLGNSDPALLRFFVEFLVIFFGVKKEDMRFGLQLFNDVSVSEALDFWGKELRIGRKQFYKVIITPSRGSGTYRKKSRFGVVTVYYNNKRLKDKLVSLLPM